MLVRWLKEGKEWVKFKVNVLTSVYRFLLQRLGRQRTASTTPKFFLCGGVNAMHRQILDAEADLWGANGCNCLPPLRLKLCLVPLFGVKKDPYLHSQCTLFNWFDLNLGEHMNWSFGKQRSYSKNIWKLSYDFGALALYSDLALSLQVIPLQLLAGSAPDLIPLEKEFINVNWTLLAFYPFLMIVFSVFCHISGVQNHSCLKKSPKFDYPTDFKFFGYKNEG